MVREAGQINKGIPGYSPGKICDHALQIGLNNAIFSIEIDYFGMLLTGEATLE